MCCLYKAIVIRHLLLFCQPLWLVHFQQFITKQLSGFRNWLILRYKFSCTGLHAVVGFVTQWHACRGVGLLAWPQHTDTWGGFQYTCQVRLGPVHLNTLVHWLSIPLLWRFIRESHCSMTNNDYIHSNLYSIHLFSTLDNLMISIMYFVILNICNT